jgi:methenyltetrahydromethanopterin cyclohydrolase
VSKTDPEAIGRTNDAVLYGGQVELTIDAPDDELEAIVERVPSSSSDDHGEPFGTVLEKAEWDFYKIDPLLFSPAEVRLVSVASGRSFHAGSVDVDVLERSFRG